MSEEQLKAFLEAVRADAGLQEKLMATADADAVVAIAKVAGFSVSVDVLSECDDIRKLSDQELESISGGGCTHWNTNPDTYFLLGNGDWNLC